MATRHTVFRVIPTLIVLYLSMTRHVTGQSCDPVNCVTSAWNAWTDCTATCGDGGTRTRKRVVLREAACDGSCAGPLVEQEPCNIQCCPLDCVYTEWSRWGLCYCATDGRTGWPESVAIICVHLLAPDNALF